MTPTTLSICWYVTEEVDVEDGLTLTWIVDVSMNELSKIRNVMKKVLPNTPDDVMLVLDASTGQNAIEQANQFIKATSVNSLALTKLDGTAKGGVIIGISNQFKIPVKYIGVGEAIDDLQIFNKKEFVDSLFK